MDNGSDKQRQFDRLKMKKVKALYEFSSNYIFHLLSVSTIMYDNAYGCKYRKYHNKDDLAFLHSNGNALTVCGGKHCGQLFSIFVANPASLFGNNGKALEQYYVFLADVYNEKNIDETTIIKYTKLYQSLHIQIDFKKDLHSHLAAKDRAICFTLADIFRKNIMIYKEKIWDVNGNKNRVKIEEYNDMLYNIDIEKYEKFLHTNYNYNYFYALFVDSIENGPQAIDICANKDIFFMDNDINLDLISHELIIYLLRSAGIDFSLSKYEEIETLAEFYNEKILGRMSEK